MFEKSAIEVIKNVWGGVVMRKNMFAVTLFCVECKRVVFLELDYWTDMQTRCFKKATYIND